VLTRRSAICLISVLLGILISCFCPAFGNSVTIFSAYDAAYIVLAEKLGAPLVTRDARLASVSGHAAPIEALLIRRRCGRQNSVRAPSRQTNAPSIANLVDELAAMSSQLIEIPGLVC